MTANDLITEERSRQDQKWGDQSHHSDYIWPSILMEEVGELSKVINEWDGNDPEHMAMLKLELTQVAAVAKAWLEYRV
jgi:NTP pyrophosphatase (non-canonical NTP hydrolase)